MNAMSRWGLRFFLVSFVACAATFAGILVGAIRYGLSIPVPSGLGTYLTVCACVGMVLTLIGCSLLVWGLAHD